MHQAGRCKVSTVDGASTITSSLNKCRRTSRWMLIRYTLTRSNDIWKVTEALYSCRKACVITVWDKEHDTSYPARYFLNVKDINYVNELHVVNSYFLPLRRVMFLESVCLHTLQTTSYTLALEFMHWKCISVSWSLNRVGRLVTWFSNPIGKFDNMYI